ncbi:unnamed protein product [Arabidopsis arenosa]|uniref:Uncharacterized protein n=1 Tax=Arabidopsis arenosa TaxID=38785 RepID=A0A8S1ZYU9_ARAAE|nr:unnamed protein product [Arabidopsis arenosa]
MVRMPCCKAEGLKKGAWTQEEDQKLIAYVQRHGEGGWRTLPDKAGRTDNEIKNHWNTHIKKRLVKKGIDPLTHKSLLDGAGKSSDHPETPHPEKSSVHHGEDDQNSNNKKSSGTSSARFLNRVANRFGHRINHNVLSNIIGRSGLLSSHTTPTTSVSECERSTSSSSTPTSSNLPMNQSITVNATSLSSSTFSDSSDPFLYDDIFGDIEDMTRFSSRCLSDVVSHDDEEFLMSDESCLENTSFVRELAMIFRENKIETTSFNDSYVTLINEVDDSFEGIDNYLG